MTLEDFISDSISQIINGVRRAQEYAEENGAKINPTSLRFVSFHGTTYLDEYNKIPAQIVDFDVAVTTKQEGETSGKVGVFVTFFKAGVEGKEGKENILTNRIKFSIPILLPNQNNINE